MSFVHRVYAGISMSTSAQHYFDPMEQTLVKGELVWYCSLLLTSGGHKIDKRVFQNPINIFYILHLWSGTLRY